jgi:hypothetical protein
MWLKDPMTNTVPDGTEIKFFVMLIAKSTRSSRQPFSNLTMARHLFSHEGSTAGKFWSAKTMTALLASPPQTLDGWRDRMSRPTLPD